MITPQLQPSLSQNKFLVFIPFWKSVPSQWLEQWGRQGEGWGRAQWEDLQTKILICVAMNTLSYYSPLITQGPPSPFLRWQRNSYHFLYCVPAGHGNPGKALTMEEWNQLMNQIYEVVMRLGFAKDHVRKVIKAHSSQNRLSIYLTCVFIDLCS